MTMTRVLRRWSITISENYCHCRLQSSHRSLAAVDLQPCLMSFILGSLCQILFVHLSTLSSHLLFLSIYFPSSMILNTLLYSSILQIFFFSTSYDISFSSLLLHLSSFLTMKCVPFFYLSPFLLIISHFYLLGYCLSFNY